MGLAASDWGLIGAWTMVELVSGWVSGRGLGGELDWGARAVAQCYSGAMRTAGAWVLARQRAVRGVQIYSFCVPKVADDLTLHVGLQLVSIGICVASAIAHGKWIARKLNW